MLRLNLSDDGKHYIQATFLNQLWLRYNESNPGTSVYGTAKPATFDISMRRTRLQLFGQLTDRVTTGLSSHTGNRGEVVLQYQIYVQ